MPSLLLKSLNVSLMNKQPNQQELLNRLTAWEGELITNGHGLQYLAAETIKLLRSDINRFWPGSLTEIEETAHEPPTRPSHS